MSKNFSDFRIISIWLLTAGIFITGMGEAMFIGILPALSKEMHLPLFGSGPLITAHALGAALGCPLVYRLRKLFRSGKALAAATALFTAGYALTCSTADPALLLTGCFTSGFGQGIYFSAALTMISNIISPGRKAAIFPALLTLLVAAMLLALPLASFFSRNWGWKGTLLSFGGIASIVSAALLPFHTTLPAREKPELSAEKNTTKPTRLLFSYTVATLSFAATYILMSYLSPLLTRQTGLTESAVNLVLVMYGVAVGTGNIISSGFQANNSLKSESVRFILHTMLLLSLWLFISSQTMTVINIFMLGLLLFTRIPLNGIYSSANTYKTDQNDTMLSVIVTITAIHSGIAAGAYVGSILLEYGFNLTAIPLFAIIFLLGSLIARYLSLWAETAKK